MRYSPAKAEPAGTDPVNVDRQTAAKLVSERLFPVSARTLERWPVSGVVVNGRRVAPLAAYLAHAQALLDVAANKRAA